MPFIAFLGCDGSGKSTVIAGVTECLISSGIPVKTGHWRPTPFSIDSTAPRSAADAPHGEPPRGLASSVLKLAWLWINWWVAWFRYLGKERQQGMLLFDRYHGDLLVDPRRYRYGGPMWMARAFSRLMPQPDHVFYLDAPPEVLLSRKQEVDSASLIRSRNAYLKLCSQSSCFHVIDASEPVETVVREVMLHLHHR